MAANAPAGNVLAFSLKSIDGQEIALKQFQGNVLLLVNTASKCGLTPQYAALEAVYKKYRDQGLVILGFPANNFMGQEPGSDREIKEFCLLNYGVSFPMFSKISVAGADIHPLYKFLVEKETNPGFDGKIAWNFTKFLVDRQGNVVARFEPKQVPDDPALIAAIEKALQEK
ncbi:MAG TPA: glutathione peroxidase [Candidatus Binatia bacterium]|nr:glutathione peroxidase [Candidatus Binatia bacterium]